MPRGPIPSALPDTLPAAFAVAAALEAGVGPDRLRAADLDASVWGVRTRSGQHSFADRCRALLVRRSDQAFISHISALRLHGSPLPSRFRQERIVDIAVPAPSRAPHASQIRGHQVGRHDIDTRHGLRASKPAAAWVESAGQLDLAELVGVGDFLIGGPHPLASRSDLAAEATTRPRHLAGRRVLDALALLDGRAESFPESLLRVALITAGLPTPEVNEPVRIDGRTFRPDLSYRQQRVAIEYQGDYHRDPDQWRADLRRRLRLEAAGWTVIEVSWSDIADPEELIARLRRLGVR